MQGWRSPIAKDFVYKLEKVMQDAGLTKGIIVSFGGLRSAARVAADKLMLRSGPGEIRQHFGDEALAGLPLDTPDYCQRARCRRRGTRDTSRWE